MKQHHIAEHLWLEECGDGTARFVVIDGRQTLSIDSRDFPDVAHACRAYREGYDPNVHYPQ